MYCRLLRIPILNSAKLLVAFSRHDYFIIYSLILIFPSILLFNHIQRTIYITFCFCCPQPGNDMISVSFFRLFRVMRLVKLLSKVQYRRHTGTAHTIQQHRNSTTNYSASLQHSYKRTCRTVLKPLHGKTTTDLSHSTWPPY